MKLGQMELLNESSPVTISEEKLQKLKAVNPWFYSVLEEVIDTHISKSHDYAVTGNPFSNFESAAAVSNTTPESVFLTMIGIKIARLNTLLGENKTPNNESIEDTKKDLAVYALLYAAYGRYKQ